MTAPGSVDPPAQPRLRVATALVLVLILVVVWNPVGNLLLPGAFYVPANIAVAGLAIVVARLAGTSWAELGLERAALPSGLRVGAVSVLVVGVAIAIVVLVPAFRSFFESDAVAADSGFERWFVPAVRIPIGTAVFEELLFRSVLFALLVRLRDRPRRRDRVVDRLRAVARRPGVGVRRRRRGRHRRRRRRHGGDHDGCRRDLRAAPRRFRGSPKFSCACALSAHCEENFGGVLRC